MAVLNAMTVPCDLLPNSPPKPKKRTGPRPGAPSIAERVESLARQSAAAIEAEKRDDDAHKRACLSQTHFRTALGALYDHSPALKPPARRR